MDVKRNITLTLEISVEEAAAMLCALRRCANDRTFDYNNKEIYADGCIHGRIEEMHSDLIKAITGLLGVE